MAGMYAAYMQGRRVELSAELASLWGLWGGWSLHEGRNPAWREIGKTLAGMVTSTCSVEGSSSQQKSIHSVIRNRLTHELVVKLMFVHTNMARSTWMLCYLSTSMGAGGAQNQVEVGGGGE